MRTPFLGLDSEQALRHVAGALADGVFTTDADGRITFWNEAAERITGWSAAEALGRDCSMLAGDVVNGCVCGGGPIRCGLALDGRSSKQCITRTKAGQFLTIVKSAVPIRDANGGAIGALESFTAVRADRAPDVAMGDGFPGLIGRHPQMQELTRLVRLVGTSGATVVIVGESGTGKDLVAEAIHRSSSRATRELVRVPCADIDRLLDADGASASPSASAVCAGVTPFERACGGTLLLDELSDLSPQGQLKLLRFLARREENRIAESGDDACDLRILCTTHADLKQLVDQRHFRADLFFRLNVFPLRVPPLRERLEDVPLIAEHVLRARVPPVELTREAAYALMAHDWPGNVRELQNVLEYAVLHSAGAPVLPSHLPSDLGRRTAAPPSIDERADLAEALARCGGNRTLAARALGISRVTLWKRMKKYGVLPTR